MVAINALLCFVLPTVLVIDTAVGGFVNTLEKLSQQESSIEEERECPPRERWDHCASCQKNCTTINDNPGACTDECRPGCVCVEKYIRGPHGQCIEPKDCSGENFCPRNEEFAACRGLCELDCSTRNETIPRNCGVGFCVSSCKCVSGYVRGPKGTCIKPEKCPADDHTTYPVKRVCPENEVWSGRAHCQTNCTNPRPDLCPRVIVEGCVCKKEYKRAPNGRCVPENQCLKKDAAFPFPFNCGPYAKHSMVTSACPDNCTNYLDKKRSCLNILLPFPGCTCNHWYVKGPNGSCIKYEQCPRKKKPEDCTNTEIWKVCGCESNCKDPQLKDSPRDKNCKEGCFCIPGYVRDEKGDCVFPFDCKKRSSFFDDNQYNSIDEQVIETDMRGKDDDNQFDPSEEEYIETEVRNKDAGIVFPLICRRNEHISICACSLDCNGVQQKECKICIPGCECREGYVKGSDGFCISVNDCPRENNQYNRIDEQVIETEMRDKDDDIQFDSSEEEHIETEVRNKDAGIVLPIICTRNETFSVSPCSLDCTDVQHKKCKISIPGCECRAGYAKGPKGNCILIKDCPRDKLPGDCTDLEYYDSCGSNCPTDCKNYNNPDINCDKSCKVDCFCLPGFVRGPKGDCIQSFNCQTAIASAEDANFCPLHEEFIACKGHCEIDCWTRNFTEPPSCPPFCVSECRCVKGYVRGPKGTCIKPDECTGEDPTTYPVVRMCPADEEWGDQAHCQKNCTNPTTSLCPRVSIFGCICKSGYLRRPDGKCVPKDKCPEKESEPVEVLEELDNVSLKSHGCPDDIRECSRYCNSNHYRKAHCYGDKCKCTHT